MINPATEEVIGTTPSGTVSDVQHAIKAARQAFDDGPWPRMSARQRSDVLLRMADAMRARYDELVALSVAESGSTHMLAHSLQVAEPTRAFHRSRRDMCCRGSTSRPGWLPRTDTFSVRVSYCANLPAWPRLITAYNFPLFLNLFKVAPALAAGCTTILKPSPYTPLQAMILGEIALEADLPPGVLNIVTGDVDASRELTTNPMVDVVSFTGSEAVGRQVNRQAADTFKRVMLELGGKSANIICDDADLDKVAPDVVRGLTIHAGQGCALLTRTLVSASRHDELVAKVQHLLAQVRVGNPADEDTVMGPLIRETQRTKVEAMIDRARTRRRSDVAFGGGRPAHLDRGFFVEPTLLVGVDNSMEIARQEVFGPVGVIIPFDGDDDAVRLANDSEYGLGGGVWSADAGRAFTIARRLRTGAVSVNGGGGLNASAPFGGYKHSGIGREWGAFGIDEFLEHKAVTWPIATG